MTPKTTDGYPPLYVLSTLFFLMALAGIVVLVGTDILHHFKLSVLHERLDAWPLMTIGLSYITLQLAINEKLDDRVKGIFLGIAFLLWGGEQLLPPSPLVTAMDEGAVTIFVIDVSLIIWGRLSLRELSQLP